MTEKYSLLLLGAGNMGGALLASWLESGLLDAGTSTVVDPYPSDRVLTLCEQHGLVINPTDDGDGYDICVLAVKPQNFATILPTLQWPSMDKTLFISIAAGMTIEAIGQLLKGQTEKANIVRTMPNLPAAIRQGMTLLCDDGTVTDQHREMATRLCQAAGETVWAKDEDGLDRLMGISGCGPAYIFLLAEALEDAARAEGASPEDARKLAQSTLVGAANHLAQDGRPAKDLREAVMSPGGTTAQAVAVLDSDQGFRPLMKEAVGAAYRRAKELSS